MKTHTSWLLGGGVGLVLVAVVFLLAPRTHAPSKEAEPSVGLPNPASALCLEAGGQLEAVVTPAGESANCVFPSGESCDEWAFFRGECPIVGVSNTALYSNGSSTVTVVYRIFNDTAVLTAPDFGLEAVTLKVAMSGSGARYLSQDGTVEFWEHQGEGRLSRAGTELFSGPIEEQAIPFEPTEVYKGRTAEGSSVLFEQQGYIRYRLTIGSVVTTGDLNTERGWHDDIDATVYVLNWRQSEDEQLVFVRKTGSESLYQLDAAREELVPEVVLTKME